MLLFCVAIVHTNLYNSISWPPARILYLELFDITFHACGERQEGHPVVENAAPILFINTPEREHYGYEGDANPIGKRTINR